MSDTTPFRSAGAPLTALTTVDLRALELHANGMHPTVALVQAARELTATPVTAPTQSRSALRRLVGHLDPVNFALGAWTAVMLVLVTMRSLHT